MNAPLISGVAKAEGSVALRYEHTDPTKNSRAVNLPGSETPAVTEDRQRSADLLALSETARKAIDAAQKQAGLPKAQPLEVHLRLMKFVLERLTGRELDVSFADRDKLKADYEQETRRRQVRYADEAQDSANISGEIRTADRQSMAFHLEVGLQHGGSIAEGLSAVDFARKDFVVHFEGSAAELSAGSYDFAFAENARSADVLPVRRAAGTVLDAITDKRPASGSGAFREKFAAYYYEAHKFSARGTLARAEARPDTVSIPLSPGPYSGNGTLSLGAAHNLQHGNSVSTAI